MEKMIMGMMIALVGILLLSQVVQGMQPRYDYECPVCGQGFLTYDEMYTHCITQHPPESLNVTWDLQWIES